MNSRDSAGYQPNSQVKRKTWTRIKRDYELYLFLLPIIIIYAVFKYYPMYGVQIAFKDFSPSQGIWGSEWVGFQHFIDFFNSYNFWTIITNTLTLSFLSLLFSFPVPIIIAIMLNQMLGKRYKKFIQTVIYAPHFISTVVLVGMLHVFLSPNSGIVNHIITWFGGTQFCLWQMKAGFVLYIYCQEFGKKPGSPQLYIWQLWRESILNCMKRQLWMEQVNGKEYGMSISQVSCRQS